MNIIRVLLFLNLIICFPLSAENSKKLIEEKTVVG